EHGLAIPVHLEAKLELVLHLLKDIAQSVVGVLEEFDRVLFGLEERPEAHRDRREAVVDHYDLVDVLVGQRILAGWVVDLERGPADHRREVAVLDGEDIVPTPADTDLSEVT